MFRAHPGTAEEMDQRQVKYKKRVARIRSIIKNMVFENAALCDQVAHMQETILCVKEERKFLLRKLIELDSDIHIDAKPNAMEQQQQQQQQQQNLHNHHHQQAHDADATAQQTPSRTRKPYKKRTQASNNAAPTTPDASTGAHAKKSKSKSHKKQLHKKQQKRHDQLLEPDHHDPTNNGAQQQAAAESTAENEHVVDFQHELTGSDAADGQPDNVQTIAIDDMGRPIYPIQMGDSLAIFDLGEIVAARIHYHSEHWLYPVGYMATRIYGHIKEPQRKCVYTCKITDGGDYPLFEIIPESDMNFAIAGPTPDLCHAALLQTMNTHSSGRHVEVRPKGEWFFGLGHPTVVTLLLQQPQVPFCKEFIGFVPDALAAERYGDATVNYEALQRYMGTSVYHHAVPEVKEEPPDQLLEQVVAVV